MSKIVSFNKSGEFQVGDHVMAHFSVKHDLEMLDRQSSGRDFLPEEIQLEVMAQSSAFVLYPEYKAHEGSKIVVAITGVKAAEFFHPIFPGMELTIKSKVVKKRGAIGLFEAEVYHGDQLMSRAQIQAVGKVEKPDK